MPLANNLVSAQTGAAFSQDPAITLKDFLEDNWEISDPAASLINFDTKLERFDKYLHCIVENISDPADIADIGASRFTHEDVKRVQLIGYRKNAKDQIWKMKERIEAIINANPTGMQANGIEQAFIIDYQDLISSPTFDDVKQPEARMTGEIRSRFLIKLRYDKVKVAV